MEGHHNFGENYCDPDDAYYQALAQGHLSELGKPFAVRARNNNTCDGCTMLDEPHPSQKYHMQPGGCLSDV